MSHRLLALPIAGLGLVLLGVLMFGNLNGNLVYYLTAGEAIEQRADFPDGRRFRLAGEVGVGSLTELEGGARFAVSDGDRAIDVIHRGAPPQLFREGIQVVVEGAWDGPLFRSDTIIVKHDNDYRPPDGGAAAGAGGDR